MFRFLSHSHQRFATNNGKRLFSSLKESRSARRAKLSETANKPFFTPATIGTLAALGGFGFVVYDIKTNPAGFLGSLYANSVVEKAVREIYRQTFGRMEDIFEPSVEKLLPDFPDAPCYAGIPPGTPVPPTLVLDLEKTLIGSTYDTRHGWRHVKRPGLDKFLKTLSRYYEIVILSDNDVGMVQELLMAIDPEGLCHKHGNTAHEVRGVTFLKRLDLMNRELGQIILIDDNPESYQLFPRNTLQIKPFTDVNDRTDTALLDLIPLLQAFVHEDVRDFRDAIDALGTHEAEEAAIEYRMRVSKRRAEEQERRNRGLGKLIRGDRSEHLDDGSVISSVLSPRDIVGGTLIADNAPPAPVEKPANLPPMPGQKERPAGPAVKKKGGLFAYLEEAEKYKEEEEMRKREKMNEIYMQRQLAKQQQQQQQQQ